MQLSSSHTGKTEETKKKSQLAVQNNKHTNTYKKTKISKED